MKSEQAMWQAQYAKCCSEMSQWDVLHDYGKQTENYSIIAAALAKTQDWLRLKEDVLPCAMVMPSPTAHSDRVRRTGRRLAAGSSCF